MPNDQQPRPLTKEEYENRIAAIREMQKRFAPFVDKNISLVDELSRERRLASLNE
jgi:hypothetical protein